MQKKFLIAYDGSEQALKAFTYALELVNCLAEKPDIRVIAVALPPEPQNLLMHDIGEDRATQRYKEFLRELQDRARAFDLSIVTEATVGQPAEYIIRYAKDHEIDTIFIGHTGKSQIESLLMGSVSKYVAIHAHCTVTIVR